MAILENVKKYLGQNNISNTVICALSGGCDSVVLTHIMHNLGLRVIAVHLNHNWRGKESERDEKFSKEFAKSLGIDFYSEKLKSDVKKTELIARELRYEFFQKCAKKFNCNFVLLAHNKNDNAETLLYRVFKGTGTRGICAIPKNRDIFYRPLLEISRDEIEIYAKENNLKYINDSSNDCIYYQRNFIRKEIIPLAKKINPDVISSINNLSEVANMHYQIICDTLTQTKRKVFKGNKIILEEFLKLSKPLKYELINDFVGPDLKYRDFKRIESYVNFIIDNHKKSSRKSIKTNLFLEISDPYVYKTSECKKNEFELQIKGEGEYVFCGKKIVIKKIQNYPNFSDLGNIHYLSMNFENKIVLRTRRDGDIFKPFGMVSGKMKLKDYLINKKIARQKRDNLLLLAEGNEILCILGLQISQKMIVEKGRPCYSLEILE